MGGGSTGGKGAGGRCGRAMVEGHNPSPVPLPLGRDAVARSVRFKLYFAHRPFSQARSEPSRRRGVRRAAQPMADKEPISMRSGVFPGRLCPRAKRAVLDLRLKPACSAARWKSAGETSRTIGPSLASEVKGLGVTASMLAWGSCRTAATCPPGRSSPRREASPTETPINSKIKAAKMKSTGSNRQFADAISQQMSSRHWKLPE